MGRSRSRSAFSLIELLVSLAIILILISLLLPAAERVRNIVKQLTCATNLRSMTVQTYLFAADFEQRVPMGVDQYQTKRVLGRYHPACESNDGNFVSFRFSTVFGATPDGKSNAYETTSYYVNADPPPNTPHPWNGAGDGYEGGLHRWRYYGFGAAIMHGYVSSPDTLYCPDQTVRKQNSEYRYQMNTDLGFQLGWKNLAMLDNSVFVDTNEFKIGYAHFLYQQKWDGSGGVTNQDRYYRRGNSTWGDFTRYTEETPFDGHEGVDLTVDKLADVWNNDAYPYNGWTPIMYACANDRYHQSHFRGNVSNDQIAGMNAGMFDGSTRWISKEEVIQLGAAQFSGEGWFDTMLANKPDRLMFNGSHDHVGYAANSKAEFGFQRIAHWGQVPLTP
jgi:prepilin-type N-terminal cleavage/methylation domain-containing protein